MWKRFKAWVLGILAVIAGVFGVQQAVIPQERVDTLTWELATSYEDGTALPQEAIASTLIQWGNSESGPFNQGSVSVPAPQTSVSVPHTAPYGTRCYVAFTVLQDGVMSVGTNPVCKTVMPPPANPRNLQVQ